MARLNLSVCVSRNPMTTALAQQRPEGIDWTVSHVHPSEMFWRQLKFGDFDVSEMSLATLLIGWEQGQRDWVALPIFTTRRFFHTGIVVRPGAGISSPADLRGRRVGVPDYQQTSAVWSRAVLAHDFGVQPAEMDWVMERSVDLSHGGTTGFTPPAGVNLSYIEPGETLATLLGRGELDASFVHLTSANLIDRASARAGREVAVEPLFADADAEASRYFGAHGLLPINHCVVVRRELVEQHPWVVLNIYSAFEAAKAEALRSARELVGLYRAPGIVSAQEYARVATGDPTPYGFASELPVLEAAAGYLVEQGLTAERVDVREVFDVRTHAF